MFLYMPTCAGPTGTALLAGQMCGWVSSTTASLWDPVGSLWDPCRQSLSEGNLYGWVATLRKSTLLISDFSFIAQNLGVMITLVARQQRLCSKESSLVALHHDHRLCRRTARQSAVSWCVGERCQRHLRAPCCR